MGNLSVSRGDNFEAHVAKTINGLDNWQARRMGGTIVNFPDVVATNNPDHTILSIEAKATTFDKYFIPIDQIIRCFRLLEMFAVYRNKYVIFAFKFLTKRAIVEHLMERFEVQRSIPNGNEVTKADMMRKRYYEKRDIRYYYFNGNELKDLVLGNDIIYSQLECDYFGNVQLTSAYRKTPVKLPQIKLDKRGIILPHQCVLTPTRINQ